MAALVGVALTASLSGCAAGQRAQTSDEFSVVDGVSADAGTVGLRDLGVAPPVSGASYARAGSAQLAMGIVNNGRAPDALVSASSPAAASVTITAPTVATAARSPSVSGSTSAAPAGVPQIEIPASSLVKINNDQGSGAVTLTNLKNPLVPGQSIQVTFTFRTAGTVTVQIPVKLQPGQTGGQTFDVKPSGE